MSRVTIYEVTKAGDVVEFAEERNAMAWAPVIWAAFMQWHLPGKHWWVESEVQQLWDLVEQGKLGPDQRFLIRLTYDRVWVRRERWPLAVAHLDGFFRRHTNGPGDKYGTDDTIPRMARAIERLAVERPEAIGFALRGTSVSPSLWELVDDAGEIVRHVNVLTAPTCADGEQAWALEYP